MSGEEEELVACYSCGAAMNVIDIAPYTRVVCPSCQTQNRVKKKFGSYVLCRRHAIGGMSTVFIAKDEALEREVAVKILSEEYSKDETRISAFEEEARLTASFSHPYVVRVLGTGQAFGRLYIAMEFVTGGHFERVIREKVRVSELEMLPLAIQIAEGLKGAKAAGLIHRDIKPGNILLDSEGNAKIVDFGLALVTKGGKARATEIWATPYYVPPEAIEGEEEDFRSDVYAFGATLYHALSGTPPCDEETMATDKLREAKKRIVPLGEVAPDLHPETCKVIDRAMAYRPDDRFARYDEMIIALKNAFRAVKGEPPLAEVDDGEGSSRAEQRQRAMRNRIIIGAVAATVVSALLVFAVTGKKEKPVKQSSANRVVEVDPNSASVTKSAEAIMMEYRAAQYAMEEGNYADAFTSFSNLLENEYVQEPTRTWAGLQAITSAFLEGQTNAAKMTARKLRQYVEASEQAGEYTPIVEPWVLEGMKGYGFYSKEQLPETVEEGSALISCMIAGLKNWEQGRLDLAMPFFAKVAQTDPSAFDGPLELYRTIADRYLRDLRRLDSPRMRMEPQTKKDCRNAIKDLSGVLTLLTTKGRAKFNIKSRLSDLRRLEQTLPKTLSKTEKSKPVDIEKRVTLLGKQYRMNAIVRLVSKENQPVFGLSKESIIGLARASSVFLGETLSDLRTNPILVSIKTLAGETVEYLGVSESGDLKGRTASGNVIDLSWNDFNPEDVIAIHRELVKNSENELERLRRHEGAVAFDWLVGDRARATAAAEKLSGESDWFRERWQALIGKTN